MTPENLPPGLVPAGGSLDFTEDTMPEPLQREHALGPGHWGVLRVSAGSVRFVDLATGVKSEVAAPGRVVIRPQAPHRLRLTGPAQCRIDFYRAPDDDAAPAPGGIAEQEVRRSFARCEAAGDFSETFYDNFTNATPAIAPFFAQTDFGRQRKLMRDSVYLMVTQDVSDPEMSALLERLRKIQKSAGRRIILKFYELWLDSICATAKDLDPEWSQPLEDYWRARLRAGMEFVMAEH